MLKQWGERFWTFPELLLSEKGQLIKVYTRGSDLSKPLVLPKISFADRAWEDAWVSRQLIDHYEGNLLLNRLELQSIALECMFTRKTAMTKFPGDRTYALMGLLRVRPTIDPTDSEFQAFARLSLANDSEHLLERMICIHPNDPSQPWHSMDDAYGSKLWEIEPNPLVKVAGIFGDDSVILDGCRAVNVRWKSFSPVPLMKLISFKRLMAACGLLTAPIIFIISATLLSLSHGKATSGSSGSSGYNFKRYPFSNTGSSSSNPLKVSGAILMVWSLLWILSMPLLVRIVYGGKTRAAPPKIFGFEGYLDIECIERQTFGARQYNLAWSAFGSPLSRNHKDEHDRVVGDDPTTDPEVKTLVERAKHAKPGDQRIFSIVNTDSMEVTLVQSARPPVVFIFAGHEGGMQRAVGCSYDWTTGTFYRETVLRMYTCTISSAARIRRCRIGLKREQPPVIPVNRYAKMQ